jgi:hypothetical protein
VRGPNFKALTFFYKSGENFSKGSRMSAVNWSNRAALQT